MNPPRPATARWSRTMLAIGFVVIACPGCESLTPGENPAMFGGITGFAAGSIARAAGASSVSNLREGAAAGAIVDAERDGGAAAGASASTAPRKPSAAKAKPVVRTPIDVGRR